ncbi:hypothetical protein S7711_06012 [Stachybotrys chartarum IBT 7711]|uniref:Potassium transport protein n=1 Tax=Stachybotrys chartarum (strain CBS 109288 / IBT 7711) TaxID=1280523 RepID=A0A084B2U2_STACB|nr:hypothetical protein S7711_06012 [Stachybotrys chartarum IBT 7711]
MERAGGTLFSYLKGIKPAFMSKTPHFSFITAHYFWVIGMTLIASIAIYASRGETNLAYIDALLFASGANTQAGLNPVDVMTLNTFQQTMIYIFSMASSPITLHGSVVYLRLYWFEKRFQGWVRDVRKRRMTLTKSRSKAKVDPRQAEEGLTDRHINILPPGSNPHRLANDGILLNSHTEDDVKLSSRLGDNYSGTASEDRESTISSSHLEKASHEGSADTSSINGTPSGKSVTTDAQQNQQGNGAVTGISFADRVKRSDGLGDDFTKFPQLRSNDDHIAIVQRQRNQDNEVLRIPGPRDTERGMGPRPLDENDFQDDDDAMINRAATGDSRPEQERTNSAAPAGRPTAITIEEPRRRRRSEIIEDVQAVGGILDTLRFRRPRFLNKNQHQTREDDASASHNIRARTADTIRSVLSRDKADDMPYLSYTPTVARNSNFVGLTLEQREELGGIEYRSLRTLAVVLLGYFWGFQVLGTVVLLPYILNNRRYGTVVDDAGASRVWWAFFTGNSAFMDLGFALTPDSMNSFNSSEYVLMFMWFFIIIGNTGFPVMLRFIIWATSLVLPKKSGLWEELRFLLDHPRRCFTLLFPSGANWWLLWILVIMNAIDLVFFIILDLHSTVVAELPVHTRVVNGLFQAAATRTAGFTCLPLSALHPAMMVLYMIMMYISVFPIAISIRRTNVYEEKSLGVYDEREDDDEDTAQNDMSATALSYVGTHLRRQLSFDLWYVFLGLFVLSISEGSKIQNGEFDLFAILFEVISAYGTVGLSLGVPTSNAALCSQFNVVGKLVIIAMQIRGRHRSLPYGLDRAVLLPREYQIGKEEPEEPNSLVRANTNVSTATSTAVQRVGTNTGRATGTARERRGSNIIVKLMHPGPAVPQEMAHHRSRSTASQIRPNLEFSRTRTEPVFEDDDDLAPLPLSSSRGHVGSFQPRHLKEMSGGD